MSTADINYKVVWVKNPFNVKKKCYKSAWSHFVHIYKNYKSLTYSTQHYTHAPKDDSYGLFVHKDKNVAIREALYLTDIFPKNRYAVFECECRELISEHDRAQSLLGHKEIVRLYKKVKLLREVYFSRKKRCLYY